MGSVHGDLVIAPGINRIAPNTWTLNKEIHCQAIKKVPPIFLERHLFCAIKSYITHMS